MSFKKIGISGNRKLQLLIALLVAWAAVLIYQQVNDSSSVFPGTGHASKKNANPDSSDPDPVLLTSKLNEKAPALGEQKRNIFGFHHPASVRAPQVEQIEEQEKQEEPVVCGDRICDEGENEENCPTDCSPPEPPLPPVTLRYIGFLSEGGSSVAFLTDGREVFMGRENDVVANKFRVLKITDQSVELGYLNRSETRTVQFQGGTGR